MQSFKFRWKRWVAGAIGLVALYAAAGFWLVPFLIKDQLPKFAQSQLARQASVADVQFNPFTLRLVARDVRLAEAAGAPLLALGALDVDFQWRSLVRRTWTFAAIRLTAPSANLVITPEGRFNLAELLDTINQWPRDEEATGLPRLVIAHFVLEQGKVEMHDRRAGYENLLSPIDFTLTNFSTLPDQADTHTFSAQSARGGKVHWRGTASVNPIRGSGELTLENVSLPEVSVYLRSYTKARVAAGQLSATLPYRFSYADGKFEAALSGAKLALGDLALAREGGSDSFVALSRLNVDGVDADPHEVVAHPLRLLAVVREENERPVLRLRIVDPRPVGRGLRCARDVEGTDHGAVVHLPAVPSVHQDREVALQEVLHLRSGPLGERCAGVEHRGAGAVLGLHSGEVRVGVGLAGE